MTQEKTALQRTMKYLMLFSFAALLLLFTNCKDRPKENTEPAGEQSDLPVQQVAPPAAEDESPAPLIDVPARFQGGNLEDFRIWVQENTVFPQDAIDYGVSGTVRVRFTVNTEGEVVDAVVANTLAPSLDAEAIRVILMSPAWEPATYEGEAVEQQFTLPVEFSL